MAISQALTRFTESLVPVCALAAGLELIAQNRDDTMGLRAVCALAVSLCALRAMIGIFG